MSKRAEAAAEPERTGTPVNFPSMLGVYLAVNAIPDAYCLVDGPDCSLYKAHFIHGRHDFESTLLRIDGRHRIAFTNVCSRGVVKEHDGIVARGIKRLAELPDCGAVLVTALPMCSITGVDYGRITRALAPSLKPAVLDVPPGSLVGDWLDGYAQTLAALARSMGLRPGRTRPGRVAVVGNLMDRNEADRRADAKELRRLVEGVGLDCVSIWLSGSSYADLRRVEEASTVVSLPYARVAARVIAERTGARLAQAPLPFGLSATREFVRVLGRAAGKKASAEAFAAAELRRVLPRFRWAYPHLFLGRRVSYVGDPYLYEGFRDIAADAGLEIAHAAISARRGHAGDRLGPEAEFEPPMEDRKTMRALLERTDLVVACHLPSLQQGRFEAPVMEFGFPSNGHHAFFERPTLGFEGYAGFMDRLAEALPARRG